MPDLYGRPYAKVGQLKAGNIVVVDGGFTCNRPYTRRRVMEDGDGLFIKCAGATEIETDKLKRFKDKHYLDGQIGYTPDTEGEYVGIYLASMLKG